MTYERNKMKRFQRYSAVLLSFHLLEATNIYLPGDQRFYFSKTIKSNTNKFDFSEQQKTKTKIEIILIKMS